MAKYRLRKSDEVIEATVGHLVADASVDGYPFTITNTLFNKLFDPVPDEPTVDPAVEKLAKVLFASDRDDEEDWESSLVDVVKDSYRRNARDILAAGYTPPPEPKVIRVGSRVRTPDSRNGTVKYIDDDVWCCVSLDGFQPWVFHRDTLTLIEEGTARG